MMGVCHLFRHLTQVAVLLAEGKTVRESARAGPSS